MRQQRFWIFKQTYSATVFGPTTVSWVIRDALTGCEGTYPNRRVAREVLRNLKLALKAGLLKVRGH